MFLRNYLINYEVKNYSHQKFIKKKHRGVNPWIHPSVCEYSKRDSNPHSRNGQRILSPSCLPFHHSSLLAETGFCAYR